MQRPASVTVFGVLNVVFGVLGLFGLAFSAVLLFAVDVQPQPMNPLPVANPVWDMWTKVNLGLGGLAVIVLIASGAGLLNLRPWGRTAAIGYSVYAIVFGLLGIGMHWFFVVQPTFDQLQGGAEPDFVAEAVAGSVGGLIGGCFGLIYPALLWFFMTRPRVVAAFGGLPTAQLESTWSTPPLDASSPFPSNNPYVSPQAATTSNFTMPGDMSPSVSESIVETFIPSGNGPALASYYLGLFSLFPCLGFPLGVAAVYYGLKGLRRVRENPAVRGGAHAWVGLICGSLFGFFNFLLLLITIIGAIGASLDR